MVEVEKGVIAVGKVKGQKAITIGIVSEIQGDDVRVRTWREEE